MKSNYLGFIKSRHSVLPRLIYNSTCKHDWADRRDANAEEYDRWPYHEKYDYTCNCHRKTLPVGKSCSPEFLSGIHKLYWRQQHDRAVQLKSPCPVFRRDLEPIHREVMERRFLLSEPNCQAWLSSSKPSYSAVLFLLLCPDFLLSVLHWDVSLFFLDYGAILYDDYQSLRILEMFSVLYS